MVKTTRIHSHTTTRLTLPFGDDGRARAIVAALLGVITLLALVFSVQAPSVPAIHDAQPQVARPAIVFIVATPTPALPTIEPLLAAAPPTVEPQIVYQTIEAPISVEVSSAPQAGPAEAWHPPLVRPECADWHPPLVPIEGCP